MTKLLLIRTNDKQTLETATTIEDAEIVLFQDAVILANKHIKETNNLLSNRKVYVFEPDATKRAVMDKLAENVEPIGYEALVDLLFSGKSVINL